MLLLRFAEAVRGQRSHLLLMSEVSLLQVFMTLERALRRACGLSLYMSTASPVDSCDGAVQAFAVRAPVETSSSFHVVTSSNCLRNFSLVFRLAGLAGDAKARNAQILQLSRD
jgi:hypothetical protein